jgi:hypothetical protein
LSTMRGAAVMRLAVKTAAALAGAGHNEGKVGVAAGFESGFGSAKAEAARKEELGGVAHVGHWRLTHLI